MEKLSYRQASERFQIPLSTLSTRVLYSLKANAGRPPALSIDEERYLVNLIITLQEWGQLCTYSDIMKYAKEYVEIMNLKSRFSDGTPKKDWYYSFLKRWRTELKIMKSGTLEDTRAKGVTPDIIDGWFNKLYSIMKKLNLLEKPQSIFNMDESGFAQDAGSRVVVVKRDTKYATQ